MDKFLKAVAKSALAIPKAVGVGWVLLIALFVALASPTILIFALRASGRRTLSWPARASFWIIGLACFLLISSQIGIMEGSQAIGLGPITPRTFWIAATTTIGLMLGAGLLSVLQRFLKLPVGDRENFSEIADTSLSFRTFLVLTAGVVEEFMFRGVGIGVGAEVFGNGVLAAVLSTFAFVLAHFRWRLAHLLQVAMAGAVLSLTYLMTGDLWACIMAHLLVDGIGFLLVPALIARR
jgi:membrane protease YdiL (CAAX protease family)